MTLFIPVLIGWATWQIVAMAAGAGVSLLAVWELVRRLNNRRHTNNMLESYLETGEIGVEEYILATGLAKSDRHAQLVFKLLMPKIREQAAAVRARKYREEYVGDATARQAAAQSAQAAATGPTPPTVATFERD